MLRDKGKEEIINICREDGYDYVVQDPEFYQLKESKICPFFKGGIKNHDYIRLTELAKKGEKVLIIDIYDGWHKPLSDEKIICSKLFSSELKETGKVSGFATVGYAWDIK